jgi:hypothetical protein
MMVTDILIHSIQGEFSEVGELRIVNTVDNSLSLARTFNKIFQKGGLAYEGKRISLSDETEDF